MDNMQEQMSNLSRDENVNKELKWQNSKALK